MIAKLIAAGVAIAAASPAMAADWDARAEAPRVYVERQEPLYAPREIVVAPAATIEPAPLVRRRYVDPVDSNALYDGPVMPSDEPVVVERTVRTAPIGPYLIDPIGPICTPGTIVRGPDGRTWLCQ
jgi:hypothetical protein